MKVDLHETTIIIHFREDSNDRAFNLKTIYKFLNENVEYNELIIVNDNKCIDPVLSSFENLPTNVRIFWFENSDHFKKSQAFNIGASYSSGSVLCFYDVDILIEPKNLKIAQDMIINGEFDHVYPFCGRFNNIQKPLFSSFLENFDFDIVKYSTEHIEIASNISPGGCNLISKEAFFRINGYDNDFIGWGFEDTDFYERSKKYNSVTYLPDKDAICWHLDHSNAIRLENPHYNNNMLKFIQNNRSL